MSNKSNKAERLQNDQYIVFVDGMDGDVYLGLNSVNEAVAHAFLNQARSVTVKCFPTAKKETKKTNRRRNFCIFKKSNWEGKLLERNYEKILQDWGEIGYIIFADRIDGVKMCCTADLNLKRIHVHVAKGIITKVTGRG